MTKGIKTDFSFPQSHFEDLSIKDTFFFFPGVCLGLIRKTLRTITILFFTHMFAKANVFLSSHFHLQASPFWGKFLHSFLLFLLSVLLF